MCVGLNVCCRIVGFRLWTGSVPCLMVEGCHVLTATIHHKHGVWPNSKCSVSVCWRSHSPPAALFLTKRQKHTHAHSHTYTHADYVGNKTLKKLLLLCYSSCSLSSLFFFFWMTKKKNKKNTVCHEVAENYSAPSDHSISSHASVKQI